MRVLERPRDESGITLILVALMMTALMIFVAMAIDLGAGRSERREDVSAADGAALGALQEAGDTARRDEAIRLANSTLGESLATGDFNTPTCAADTAALPRRATGANCISWNIARTQLRVKLPTRAIQFIGQAADLPKVKHSAAATAALTSAGQGGILPFGLAGGSANHVCLKTGPTTAPPCDGPGSGGFGFLAFEMYGNADVNTAFECTNGDPGQSQLKNNMAAGIDHQLSLWGAGRLPHGTTTVADYPDCGTNGFPNAAQVDTGNTPQTFGEGLFSEPAGTYSDGGPSRLGRVIGGWWGASERTNVTGNDVDDIAVWELIAPENGLEGPSITGADVPASCQRNQFLDSTGVDGSGGPAGNGSNISNVAPGLVWTKITTAPLNPGNAPSVRLRLLMERCFDHYEGLTWNGDAPTGCALPQCTDPVFTRDSETESPIDLVDIQLSPRFGYTPELLDNPLTPGTKRISRFRAVFMHRVCIGNNASSCVVYEPGLGQSVPDGPGNNDQRANYLTAFAFHDGMLPNGLADPAAPFNIGTNRRVALIR